MGGAPSAHMVMYPTCALPTPRPFSGPPEAAERPFASASPRSRRSALLAL